MSIPIAQRVIVFSNSQGNSLYCSYAVPVPVMTHSIHKVDLPRELEAV